MLHIGLPPRPPSLAPRIVRTALALVVLGAIAGLLVLFPFPFGFMPWPWAVAVTVVVGMIVVLVVYWCQTR